MALIRMKAPVYIKGNILWAGVEDIKYKKYIYTR